MTDPRYKALLIGNGRFDRDPHQLAALKGPDNDLRVLREALTHSRYGLFDANNVRHILDGHCSEVMESIELFFSQAGPEDHLFFYYTGHGYPDTNNNLYLCTRDTRTTLLASSAIPDKTINLMAENSRARKFIFILDCCHSGGFKGGTAGLHLAHGSGRCLITSCASDQLSADAAMQSGASTFTHFLAEALTSDEVDADGDGVVLTSEVFKYVQPRVYNATKQTVQWTMDKTFGEAAIARATARGKGPRNAATNETIPENRGRPMLEVSETRIEFRDVQPGESLPVERLDVFNAGDGTLDWSVACEEPWIHVERKDECIFVTLDTAEPGLRRGNIFVRDGGRGGSRTVRVMLHVVEPEIPRLVLSPDRLEFGAHARGQCPPLEVRVSNAGPGQLRWEIEPPAPPLSIDRHDGGFRVEVGADYVGTLKGSVRVRSNGGEREMAVSGTITPPLQRVDPGLQQFVGWWTNNSGAINIRLENQVLAFKDYNHLGIPVGQGAIHVQNGVGHVQGNNAFSGAYQGQFSIQGNMLNGSMTTAFGQAMPVMFMRQDPWFSAIVG